LLAAGASRIVIGSLAVRDHDAVAAMISDFGSETVCLAADVVRRNGRFMIAVSGWQEASDLGLDTFIDGFADAGLTHVLCTDIDRDGTYDRSQPFALRRCEGALSLDPASGIWWC
jgi:phosphoribosylformimino-5-aminoimidazole carboxamide ribotide isomerase